MMRLIPPCLFCMIAFISCTEDALLQEVLESARQRLQVKEYSGLYLSGSDNSPNPVLYPCDSVLTPKDERDIDQGHGFPRYFYAVKGWVVCRPIDSFLERDSIIESPMRRYLASRYPEDSLDYLDPLKSPSFEPLFITVRGAVFRKLASDPCVTLNYEGMMIYIYEVIDVQEPYYVQCP